MTTLAYILSPGYSGSTLLTFLLAAHPKIATIGELKALGRGQAPDYRCSCGATLEQCPFWRQVAEQLAQRGYRGPLVGVNTHFRCAQLPLADRILRAQVRGPGFELLRWVGFALVPTAAHQRRAIVETNAALIEVICQLTGATVFLDGSKDPVRLLYLARARRFPIKAIHLVRDGRGVSNSYRKHYGTSLAAAAIEWAKTIGECQHVLERLPKDRQLQVHYETLCRQPQEELDKIFDFLDLDPAASRPDLSQLEHHILGNDMRLGGVNQITLDEKWRHELNPQDLAVFEHLAGALNRSYGYEPVAS